MSEEDLFAEAMGKVKPMKSSEKVAPAKPKRRHPAENIRYRSVHSGTVVPPSAALSVQATDDPWTFIADGVSRERIKRLAAGRPPIGMNFDLHGLTRDEALGQLEQGFAQALSQGERVVCIIHGRGLHSQGRPVLKQAVYQWLRQGAYAHALLAVIPQPGSSGGACLVLLRRKQT